MIKIAIDPGASGAVAVDFGNKVYAYKCPETPREMIDLIRDIKPDIAVIEKVHSMPGQGVKSVWNFSKNYAWWQMALIACGVSYTEKSPQSWMKQLGGLPADKSARKKHIKDAMQKKYPDLKVTLATADALALLSVMDRI